MVPACAGHVHVTSVGEAPKNSAGLMSHIVRLHLTYDGRADGPPTIICGGGLVEFRTADAIRSYMLGLERLLAAIDDHHQLEERV